MRPQGRARDCRVFTHRHALLASEVQACAHRELLKSRSALAAQLDWGCAIGHMHTLQITHVRVCARTACSAGHARGDGKHIPWPCELVRSVSCTRAHLADVSSGLACSWQLPQCMSQLMASPIAEKLSCLYVHMRCRNLCQGRWLDTVSSGEQDLESFSQGVLRFCLAFSRRPAYPLKHLAVRTCPAASVACWLCSLARHSCSIHSCQEPIGPRLTLKIQLSI